ncbi:MAG: DMT family transporter [Clostridia bacterium]|jgi:drug/metabolite transporter (DMT)-like permease
MQINKLKSMVALFLTVIFWGLAYPTVSNVLHLGVSIGVLNILRFGSATLVLLPFFIKDLLKIKKQEFIFGLLCGIVLFFGFLFGSLALKEENAPGISALIVGTGIFVVPLLAYLIHKIKPTRLSVLGVVISFLGIVLFSYSGNFEFNINLSTLYSFLAAICFGSHIFILATYIKDFNVKVISVVQVFVVFVLFLIFSLIFMPNTLSFNLEPIIWLQILFLGVFGAALAYLFQTYASKHLSSNTCNIILNMEALFAVIFSIIFGLENITIYYILGAIFMLSGITLAITQENKNSNKT